MCQPAIKNSKEIFFILNTKLKIAILNFQYFMIIIFFEIYQRYYIDI